MPPGGKHHFYSIGFLLPNWSVTLSFGKLFGQVHTRAELCVLPLLEEDCPHGHATSVYLHNELAAFVRVDKDRFRREQRFKEAEYLQAGVQFSIAPGNFCFEFLPLVFNKSVSGTAIEAKSIDMKGR